MGKNESASARENIERDLKFQEQYVNEECSYDGKPIGDETNWEFVSNCDWESEDFNVGFEQGILRGREEAIQYIKEEEKEEPEVTALRERLGNTNHKTQ